MSEAEEMAWRRAAPPPPGMSQLEEVQWRRNMRPPPPSTSNTTCVKGHGEGAGGRERAAATTRVYCRKANEPNLRVQIRRLVEDQASLLLRLQERLEPLESGAASHRVRVQLIGHLQPCMTEIYLHIVARMAD